MIQDTTMYNTALSNLSKILLTAPEIFLGLPHVLNTKSTYVSAGSYGLDHIWDTLDGVFARWVMLESTHAIVTSQGLR